MKIFIAFLLIFSSYSDGQTTTTTTSTTTTMGTTTTTMSTTTGTITVTVTTISTTQTTTSALTSSPIPTTTTRSPTADVGVNVTWIFYSGINVTNILMTINSLQKGQWAAIGFGQQQAMSDAHVFMCKRFPDDTVGIKRYMNGDNYAYPMPAGSEQGGFLTPGIQVYLNGDVICQFNLSNFTAQSSEQLKDLQPLSQSRSYHPLFAIGPLDPTDEPLKHNSDSRTPLPDTVTLNGNKTVLYRVTNPDTGDSMKYIRAHGIIMVFAWILIVSTGVLISRYFKKSWANHLVCGKAAWFAAHRFLMSIAAVLTTLAFLFILSALGGTWVSTQDGKKAFAHSITGVIVISFAFFQPFGALFRCEPDSRYRFIFNYIHAFLGFSAFILSVATLFLATYFRLFTSNKARILMIIWAIWIVFIFVAFEVIDNYFRKNSDQSLYSNINSSNKTVEEIVENPTSPTITLAHAYNEQQTSTEEKWKNILLTTHILVAAVISVIFSTFIA